MSEEQSNETDDVRSPIRRRTLLQLAVGAGAFPLGVAAGRAADGFVDVLSADPSNFPTIGLNVRVDTDAGRDGRLTRDDFTVFEDGERRPLTGFEFSSTSLDLAFVFDDSGSMGGEIATMKREVKTLTDQIAASGIDARYGLVSFRDDVGTDLAFTGSAAALKSAVDSLEASGGGDFPEDNFDAIETALGLGFRDSAQKVIIDITDATSHHSGDGSGFSGHTLSEVATDLQEAGVAYIAVSPGFDDPNASLKVLAQQAGGLWIDIDTADFDLILRRITELLVETYVLEYETTALPGESLDFGVTVRDPERGRDTATGTVMVPEDAGPDLPARFEELRSAKLDLAGQIDAISQSISETPGVEATLDDLASRVESGDLGASTAISAVERMILGENLTEVSLAGLGPVSVSSPESPTSRVGEPAGSPAAKDSFDIAGAVVENTLFLLAGLLLAFAGFKSVASWLSKFSSRINDAIEFLDNAITTVFGVIPFLKARIEEAARAIQGVLEGEVEGGETDGDDLFDVAAEEVQELRDPFSNELMAELEGGFEANLEAFDRDLGLDDDGEFGFEGDDGGAAEAAAAARDRVVDALEQTQEELDVTGFVAGVGDLMALGGAILSVTGIFTVVGTALAILGAFFGMSFTFLGAVAAADGLFDVRGLHNDGLDAIVQGGA